MPSSSAATPTPPRRSSRRSPASAAAPAAEILADEAFGRLIEALGPFELAPILAVGVSGGADSLALTLLADRWARAHGGVVVGLTVDHRLRPGSADESQLVAGWFVSRGIEHHTLVWPGPHPTSGLQAAARDARLDLLGDWCRARGVLHLLLAHHADDQAETIAMRAARASGEAGLAGMPAVREIRGLRLLRPLLPVPKARLVATLKALCQPWLEDPSNRDPRFERARIRAGTMAGARAAPPPLPPAPSPLVGEGWGGGAARTAQDLALARALAGTVRLHPAGFARIDRKAWRLLPEDLRAGVLARVLTTVGGGRYAPRRARLARLAEILASEDVDHSTASVDPPPTPTLPHKGGGGKMLAHRDSLPSLLEGEAPHLFPSPLVGEGRVGGGPDPELEWSHGLSPATLGRTLGGCLVRASEREILVVREPGAVTGAIALPPGGEVRFDRRFLVRSAPDSPPLLVRRLGPDGWRALRAAGEHEALLVLPHPVRLGLPALWPSRPLDRTRAPPHVPSWEKAADTVASACFSPERALGEAAFATMPLFEQGAQPILGAV